LYLFRAIVHTQAEFHIRLVARRIHRRAVQLTCHTFLESSPACQGLIARIKADDVVFEGACIGADGFAGRSGYGLEGRGDTEADNQQAEQQPQRRTGRRRVMPVGHDTDGEGSDI
jgi:hypothetical protein